MTPVRVRVSSGIDYGSHRESYSFECKGKRFERAGGISLRYDDISAEGAPPRATVAHITDPGGSPTVTIHRPAMPRGDMIFSPGRSCDFFYSTPMGIIPLSILTGHLALEITDSFLSIEIKYELSDADSPLSQNHIHITAETLS